MLVNEVSIQIPTVVVNNSNTFAYVESGYQFRDDISGLYLYYTSTPFDARPSMNKDTLYFDIYPDGGGSHTAIVGTIPGRSSRYGTFIGGSAGFQYLPYLGYRTFKYGISKQNLLNAIADIKARYPDIYATLSTDVRTYRLMGYSVLAEVVANQGVTGPAAQLGISFMGAKVYVQ